VVPAQVDVIDLDGLLGEGDKSNDTGKTKNKFENVMQIEGVVLVNPVIFMVLASPVTFIINT
jgi:hypothetical protein